MEKLSSIEFMNSFISLYRDIPCLWKISDSDYFNRFKKEEGYQRLTKLLQTFYPDGNIELTKTKIKCLRNVFVREFKKLEQSKKSGTEEIYAPRLWYFDNLMFLKDQIKPRIGVYSFRAAATDDIQLDDDSLEEDKDDFNVEAIHEDIQPELQPERNVKRKRCAKKQLPCSQRLLDLAEEASTGPPHSQRLSCLAEESSTAPLHDDNSGFGQMVSSRLNSMNRDQRCLAEMIIISTLYNGSQNCLNRTHLNFFIASSTFSTDSRSASTS